ncbi:MAG: hypothetical protein JWO03_2022 [Bacteroidetes bacterium]|nr:hypothetical protein [Bacteroidota bacterium]
MKTRFIQILLLLLFPIILSAQADMEDVIYLKNGSVYRGTIIEQKPGISYKIEIMGGSIISIVAADIEKVTHESRPYDPERSEARHGGSGHSRRVKREHYAKIEAAGSGLLYFRQPFGYGNERDIAGGGGLSFMTELGRRGGCFSLVTGAAVQFLNLHNFHSDISTSYYNTTLFDIGTGVQTRFQVPFLFRWTFGQKVPVFFQFGFSAGFSCYQGRGVETTRSGYYGYGNPFTRTYGWQKYYDGFFNISSVGIGFKQKVNSSLDFILYAEGSPGNLVITNNTVYQPYLELHAGVSFDAKRYRQSKKAGVKVF